MQAGTQNKWIALVREWQAETGSTGDVDPDEVSAWALRTGRAQPQAVDAVRLVAKSIRRAFRETRITDPQNRSVRDWYGLPEGIEIKGVPVQRVLWNTRDASTPERMRRAFSYRRQAVGYDCARLQTEVDSYNDNNPHGAHIQLDLNFNKDRDELRQPTDYPDEPPPDDGGSPVPA